MQYSFDLDFFLDGSSAKSVGIIMQHEPSFSPIEANLETFEIPGRTGALHVFDGTYKMRTVTIDCYCLRYDEGRDSEEYTGVGVYSPLNSAEAFLFPRGESLYSFRKLSFKPWFESQYYYKAFIRNGMEVQARICTLAPFSIQFEIYPFMDVG